MDWIIGLTLILVAVGWLLVRVKKLEAKSKQPNAPKDDSIPSYQRKGPLYTPAERSFLGVLELAVNTGHRVQGKVRVADVLTPKNGMTRPKWQSAFNRIKAKHFDYVVCEATTFDVVCAIELDDASHNRDAVKDRDAFLNQICAEAKVPLVRIAARQSYQVKDVREALSKAVSGYGHGEPKASPTLVL